MYAHTMLIGAICLATVNVYGILISTIVQPVTPVLLGLSISVILFLGYVQFNKERVLMQGCKRQSFVLFAIIIIFQIYFVITALTILVYLNQFEQKDLQTNLNLKPLIAGLDTLPVHKTEMLNLPYYFANFLFFMFYIRCYYVMFFRENIVFIFRYLKAQVKELNQELLAHLPKVPITEQMKDNICALCLQHLNNQEDLTKLHCQHVFHLNCVKIWIMKSNCCPLCRKKVIF